MPRHRTILILLVVLGSLALGLYGCGKISPTALETEGLSTPPIQPPKNGLPSEVLWPKMMVECDTVHIEAKIYDDTWNFVDLPLPGYYHWFIVPEEAVEEDVTITIAIVRYTYWDEDEQEWSYMAEFDFGPDGLEFDEDDPARLVIDAIWLDLEGNEQAVLRYYNEDTDLWEEVASTKVRWRRVKFYLEHFSMYAISR